MATTRLTLENVSLIFRVYGVGGRSLKKKLISFGTGGRLARDAANHFVVHALNNLSMELNEGDRLGSWAPTARENPHCSAPWRGFTGPTPAA